MEGSVKSRRIYEGEEVLNAGHVILCGQLHSDEKNIVIYALCLQSSALQSDPHIIKGVFVVNGTKAVVDNISCTCKGGNSARCKHISAVLLKVTRLPLNELETLSQTDVACTWKSSKAVAKDKYTAVPISDMPCFQKKFHSVQLPSEDIMNKIRQNFLKDLPQSSLHLHSLRRRGIKNDYLHALLNNCCQSILMMELYSCEVEIRECCNKKIDGFTRDEYEVAIRTSISQMEWHKERRDRITGTKIYDIYTYSKGDWEQKNEKFFNPKHFTNKYVQYGLKYEKVAREFFKNVTKYDVKEFGFITSYFNNWLGFSPDGVIFEGNEPIALLEIKCPYAGSRETIESVMKNLHYSNGCNGSYSLKEKHTYYGQVQMGMALLNLPICYFVIFCASDNSMEVIKIGLNYNFARSLLFDVKEKYF